MKVKFKSSKESHSVRLCRFLTTGSYERQNLLADLSEEDEVIEEKPPAKFSKNPIRWIGEKIQKGFDLFRSNLYDGMDVTAVIYKLNKQDLKRFGRGGFESLNVNGVIVLMSSPVMQRKYVAVIKWKGSKADKWKKALDMLILMADPTFVTVPPLTITATRTLANTYGNSSAGGEDAAFTALNNAMQAIMFLYQSYANSHVGSESDSIKSGGFDIKKVTARGQQPWKAVNSVVQGTIDLTANGVEVKGGFHEWLISFDGITFERMLPTTHAHTQVTNLAGGIEVWFMHQEIDNRGPQGFDLVIQITVNR